MDETAKKGLSLMDGFLGVSDGRESRIESAASIPSLPRQDMGGSNNGTWYVDKAARRSLQEEHRTLSQAERQLRQTSVRNRQVHDRMARRFSMLSAAIIAVMAAVSLAGYEVYENRTPTPAPVYACQDGDGGTACIPVRLRDGTWSLVGLTRDGKINADDMPEKAHYPVLTASGVQFRGLRTIRHGKSSSEYVLDLPGGAAMPVLMPNGSLALVPGYADQLALTGARKIADVANATRPETMLDAVRPGPAAF